jgi:TolB-like protein/Flp pilus assembly protein TadD
MEYLSAGLTDSIILSLSQLPHLKVMSRSAVFRFKGKTDQIQDAGRALNVAAVLTGKVLELGGTLLITAELVDAANGWQLWGGQYKRKTDDIFALQDDIAKDISEKLRLKLTPEKQTFLARRYTENVEAYHLYLKGRFYWAKRTAEGLFKGIQYFRQAIELDPTYALAYAGLAEGYVPLTVYCHLAPSDAAPKAKAAAQRALEINPDLVEARTVLGAVKSYYEWDFARAEQILRAAVELDPNYARARQALSENLMMTRRFSEAEAEARRALELDPLALSLNAFMSMTHYFDRQYDTAIEYGRKTVEMDPNFFPTYFYLGMAYQQNGQFAEAAAAFEQARKLSNNSSLMVAGLGGVFAGWGRRNEARNILHELDEMGHRKYVSQVFVSAIFTALGEREEALARFERAYAERCTWLPRCLAADARFDSLRSEARFQDLVRRVGVPQ